MSRASITGALGAPNWPAIALGVAIIGLWEALTRGLALPQNIFPPPSAVIWSLYVRLDLLMDHAWLTFYQTVIGFLLSVLVGVLLGWTISKSRFLFEALYPVIVVLQVMPKEALAPLLVLWFGAGTLSRMILAFLIAFFPMVINTIFGVRSLNPAMRDYATSLRCGYWQFFAKVELPWALTVDFRRHEDFRDAVGHRHRRRRDRGGAQRPGLPVAVRLQPPRYGLLAGDSPGAGDLGRRAVLRHRIAGAARDLLAPLMRRSRPAPGA